MARIDFTRKVNEYKEKSDEEILQFLSDFWNIKPDINGVFTLVARYKKSEIRDKKGNEFGMFVDVRNTIGDILYYPFFLGKVSIWTKCNPKFEKQDYWQINVKLSDKKFRRKNPFALTMANTIVGLPSMKYKDKLDKEILIKKIFEETGSTERDAKNTSNALHAIMGDLYTETERFIFELLQNADDQPKDGFMVEVTLKTLDENLLFLHSGKPFSNEDVESISSIGDSTKKNDSEKTGYKGIGFKSVFSDAETVFINSGNFSFAFDKHSPVYSADANMDEIPWQIKPIWEEKYRLPKEVQGDEQFFTSSVAIALNVGTENIDKYARIIPKLLSEPRFVLFLRNIGKIIFKDNNGNTIEIQKTISENIIQVNSNELNENWIIKDFVIPIPPETREEIQNEKLIPSKLKQATRTKITFAARIDDKKIFPVNNSVLFTYLPTKVNDFDFPFLVNADFLTTASRESIHFKNIWNRFIFSQIGRLLVDWAETLNEYDGALNVLPTKEFEEDNCLGNDFQIFYKEALAQKSFIKSHKGNILPQNKIILDESGLSEIIGKDLFCEILGTEMQLPHNEIDYDILRHDIFDSIKRIRLEDVKIHLNNSNALQKWYIEADKDNKNKLNNWLKGNKCEEIIAMLPLFDFIDGAKSIQFVEENKYYVLLSDKFDNLRSICEKLGLKYATNTNEELYVFSDKELFDRIAERLVIYKGLICELREVQDILAGVGCEEIYYIDSYNDLIKKLNKNGFLSDHDRISLDEIRPDYFISEDNTLDIDPQDIFNMMQSQYLFYLRPNTVNDIFNHHKLSLNEKRCLIETKFENVGEAQVKALPLFDSINNSVFKNGGIPVSLKEMLPFRVDAPDYIAPYMICESEYTEDLDKYLIPKEDEFEKVVWPHILSGDIKESSTNIISLYKLEGKDIRRFIERCSSNAELSEFLGIIEDSDKETRISYLDKINSIQLTDGREYPKDSFEYRILMLAISTLDKPSNFSRKIFYNETCITEFSVKDEVICKYSENGVEKQAKMSLARLLPQYQNQSDSIEKIKSLFEVKKDLNKFFEAKAIDANSIIKQLQEENILGLKPGMWPSSRNGNALQYLFYVHYYRWVKNYTSTYVISIKLEEESDLFIAEMLDFLLKYNIDVKTSPFTYRIHKYFINKYFANEYVDSSDWILSPIEKWADNDEKRHYLITQGVKTERAKLVQLRKAIINNESVNLSDVESQKENLLSSLNLFASKGLLPFSGGNQISAMKMFESNCRYVLSHYDIEAFKSSSSEYDLPEYLSWKTEDKISIFLYEKMMPKKLVYTSGIDQLICRYEEGNYHYEQSNKTLYINNQCEIRDILYAVVSDNKIPFEAVDWQKLFYDNLVPKSEVESIEKENQALKNEIEEYKRRFGSLTEDSINSIDGKNENFDNSSTHKHYEENEIEVRNHGNDTDKDTIDEDARKDINREARIAAKEYLDGITDYDTSEWDVNACSNLIQRIVKYKGEPITIAVTSSWRRKLYLHPRVFAEIMGNSNNLLLNYGSDNRIHSLSFQDVFTDNPNVNLIFDTDVVNPKEIAELANKYMYSKRTCFVIENPKYSCSDTIQSFGLNEKKEDGWVAVDFSDDDIFNFTD